MSMMNQVLAVIDIVPTVEPHRHHFGENLVLSNFCVSFFLCHPTCTNLSFKRMNNVK